MYQQKNKQLGVIPIGIQAAVATIGPIITRAKAIIGKVAPLLQNVFSSKATKALKAQKGEYDAANTQLRNEIVQLNSALAELQAQGAAISTQMKQAGINGLGGFDDLGGLFSNIIDKITGKTKATAQLNTAKATYDALSKERDQKLTAANEMVQQIDALQKRLEDAIKSQNSVLPGVSNNALMVIGGLGILTLAAVAVSSSNKKTKSKK